MDACYSSSTVVLLLLVLSCMQLVVQGSLDNQYGLRKSYYGVSCPNAEEIVTKTVTKAVKHDSRSAASLGCDGSVLLDNSTTAMSEKEARPNINTLRGFGIIERIKESLENACSETVSCADILALAARDSVVQTGGPHYDVLLGRRDSIIANYTGANAVLPSPKFNVTTLTKKFLDVGLTSEDMVTLSGAHTIGKTHCTSITTRLYNQSGTTKPDPAIPAEMLRKLQTKCPNDPTDLKTTLVLDDETPEVFDNQYFKNLLNKRGILYSDQILADTEGFNLDLVNLYANDQNAFFDAFVKSMTRMGNISPLMGTSGEIRKRCDRVNL
ncbi:peroxidase A2 isoform X2 [Physcomitrium patens]|uniref:peroxidase A2 isoform X2 n=1 Tax=Physcomitrium patens TaxID=3218 RepID=UPI000D17A98C|nr:peroxidase A2-like isoform X2 [Physcomitrium patens]|eukprot:XP_024400591.1 peroxidase A2-like isoform X2 [Physcomitrella patens]